MSAVSLTWRAGGGTFCTRLGARVEGETQTPRSGLLACDGVVHMDRRFLRDVAEVAPGPRESGFRVQGSGFRV